MPQVPGHCGRARQGIAVELRFLDVALPELLRRVEAREALAGEDEPPITGEHLEEWSQRFQIPHEAELGLFDEPEKI